MTEPTEPSEAPTEPIEVPVEAETEPMKVEHWVRDDVRIPTPAEARAHVEPTLHRQVLESSAQENSYTLSMNRVWATVLLGALLGFFFLIGFVVHTISGEHSGRVDVYCDTDSTNDEWERVYHGQPQDVLGACDRR